MTLNQPNKHLLRFNVGFLLKEAAGYNREFTFNEDVQFSTDDVTLNGLHGSLHLTRTPQGILVQGMLETSTSTNCTRCLTPFDFHIDVELSELFVYPKTSVEESPYYVDEQGNINIAPIVREEGILAIPIQSLCHVDCKGLCSQCGQDLNELECDCNHKRIDPRLAGLRALLDE